MDGGLAVIKSARNKLSVSSTLIAVSLGPNPSPDSMQLRHGPSIISIISFRLLAMSSAFMLSMPECKPGFLNELFCVTVFELVPQRFRDFYWIIKVVHLHEKPAITCLMQHNEAWFCPLEEYDDLEMEKDTTTFTGKRARPTALWRLAFTIGMMVLNTLRQAVVMFFTWH